VFDSIDPTYAVVKDDIFEDASVTQSVDKNMDVLMRAQMSDS